MSDEKAETIAKTDNGLEDIPLSKQLMKLAFELGPIGVFFFANAKWDIFTATACFMAATFAALIGSKIVFKKIAVMPLITGVFVFLMGGLTLYLSDEFFIKVKPTIVNLIFASILLGGLYFRQYLFKLLFSDALKLDDDGWRKLTVRWGCFFIFLAVLNELVWRNFSTDTWVSFKFMGVLPLTFAFAVAQFNLIQKHQITQEVGETK